MRARFVVVDLLLLCQLLTFGEDVEALTVDRFSPRIQPLNDLTQAFSHDEPGSMKIVDVALHLHQTAIADASNSRPLSNLKHAGWPRSPGILSRTAMTGSAAIERLRWRLPALRI